MTKRQFWECINAGGMEKNLTLGKVYEGSVTPTAEDWLNIIKSDRGYYDGAFLYRFREVPEPGTPEKEAKGEFIIWSPDANKAPTKRYFTYKQARYVARKMSVEHTATFYVLRAECKYVSETTTVKTEL